MLSPVIGVTGLKRLDRVLCAVSFSPSSQQLVAWAASLAGASDGEMRLFHVLPGPDEHPPTALETDYERAFTQLSALARDLPVRQRISAAVTEGDAAAEILRHARMMQADVIAVGMHAQDGRVSGLIARLAIEASCPVLAVNETVTPPLGRRGLDHILVAVDFRPASLAAADCAFALAHTVDAHVTVVHVVPEHWDGPRRERDTNADDARQLVEHHFRQRLQAAVREVSGSCCEHSVLVTSGRPCVEIVRVATTRDAGLIVMGIDARRRSRGEFGEATGCVMQFARRTVLLVPDRLDDAMGFQHIAP